MEDILRIPETSRKVKPVHRLNITSNERSPTGLPRGPHLRPIPSIYISSQSIRAQMLPVATFFKKSCTATLHGGRCVSRCCGDIAKYAAWTPPQETFNMKSQFEIASQVQLQRKTVPVQKKGRKCSSLLLRASATSSCRVLNLLRSPSGSASTACFSSSAISS